jgi:hypothetical protein
VGSVGAIDGSQGWARNLWTMLNEGGVWMVPRSWMALVKRDGQLIVDRMPWSPSIAIPEWEFRAMQDDDVQGIRDMFAVIGVEVIDPIPAKSGEEGEGRG